MNAHVQRNAVAHPCRDSGQQHVDVHYPEDLSQFIPQCEWDLYSAVIGKARAAGIAFAMSGGFASSFYTAAWRNTKDLDLVVMRRDRDALVQATRDAGFGDLYDTKPYDRGWIYRSIREGVIVDVIWCLANYAGDVDEAWLTCGPEVQLFGESVRLVPAEEMIWSKIHVVQRERCDAPDILNMLYAAGAQLDWNRLFRRLEGDEALLASVVSLFAWLAPGRALRFPPWIWRRLGLQAPQNGPDRDENRIRRLDSRPWFTPLGLARGSSQVA